MAEPSVIASPTNVSKDGEPITAEEREYYLAKIKANLTLERTGKELLSNSLDSFSEFAKNDDGKPFYMINLVRENETPQYPDRWKGDRAKSVLDAKILYAKACAPIIMGKAGSYSMTGVTYASSEVVNSGVDVEDWDQFYLIAYPNRRAFMELLASNAYADALVHKYAGDKDTLLIPVTAGTMTVKK